MRTEKNISTEDMMNNVADVKIISLKIDLKNGETQYFHCKQTKPLEVIIELMKDNCWNWELKEFICKDSLYSDENHVFTGYLGLRNFIF